MFLLLRTIQQNAIMKMPFVAKLRAQLYSYLHAKKKIKPQLPYINNLDHSYHLLCQCFVPAYTYTFLLVTYCKPHAKHIHQLQLFAWFCQNIFRFHIWAFSTLLLFPKHHNHLLEASVGHGLAGHCLNSLLTILSSSF